MNRHDPALYRKLSEPFATAGESNAAIERFHELVRAAREECHIPDVLVVVELRYTTESGTEAMGRTLFSLGDTSHSESMAVWSSGYLAAERQAMHSRMLKQAALMAVQAEGERG